MDSSSETHARPTSSHPVEPGGFAPGTIFASRHRIVSLAGRGGMGEVSRADDLKLGRPVALKFLPEALERDPAAHDRLLAEMRSARTVSHPNVCRVCDVGELEGSAAFARRASAGQGAQGSGVEQHDAGRRRVFLTMEYIDGEDLASLLRRIGKLPAARAQEVARQLCAGWPRASSRSPSCSRSRARRAWPI